MCDENNILLKINNINYHIYYNSVFVDTQYQRCCLDEHKNIIYNTFLPEIYSSDINIMKNYIIECYNNNTGIYISDEQIFYLMNSYGNNIQHFITECMYKIEYFKEIKKINKYLKIGIFDINFIKEFLSYLNIDDDDIVILNNMTTYKAIYTTDYFYVNFSDYNIFLFDQLKCIKNNLSIKIDKKNTFLNNLIYLSRNFDHVNNSGKNRTFLSENKMLEYLKNYKYITCENMTIEHKYKELFNCTKMVTHLGANIMNIMYCDNLLSLFIIVPINFNNSYVWFHNFVKKIHPNCDMKFTVCVNISDNLNVNSPYQLNDSNEKDIIEFINN